MPTFIQINPSITLDGQRTDGRPEETVTH